MSIFVSVLGYHLKSHSLRSEEEREIYCSGYLPEQVDICDTKGKRCGMYQKEPVNTCLVLAVIEMVHVDKRDDIAVLVIVQKHTNLIEQELDVEFGGFLV